MLFDKQTRIMKLAAKRETKASGKLIKKDVPKKGRKIK